MSGIKIISRFTQMIADGKTDDFVRTGIRIIGKET